MAHPGENCQCVLFPTGGGELTVPRQVSERAWRSSGPCPFYLLTSVLGMQPDLNVSHTQRGETEAGARRAGRVASVKLRFSRRLPRVSFLFGDMFKFKGQETEPGEGRGWKLLAGREGRRAIGG